MQTLRLLQERLIAEGQQLLDAPPNLPVAFVEAEDVEAARSNELISDLARHPHAFLLACLANRQYRADLVWRIPEKIRAALGSFDIEQLAMMSDDDWRSVMAGPPALHRLWPQIATTYRLAVERVMRDYDGDAARIWNGVPSAATVVRRFLEFHGAGPKIASVATNILVREFHIKLTDVQFVDIAADVHVRRMMLRLGFVREGADLDIVICAAREASPSFPGVFDVVLWRLGRDICRPITPLCGVCPYRDLCPSAQALAAR
jgi:uncharacterized HhH-GPD family protein